jgi:hypothetical protein
VTLGRPAGVPAPPAETNQPTPGPIPTITGSTGQYGIRLDVVRGNVLVTADGTQWTLDQAPTYMARVPVGWLYSVADGATMLLRPDGTTITLAGIKLGEPKGFEQPNHTVVSADGRRLAWVTGTTLHAGSLTATGVVDVRTSPVPVDSFAQTWIGGRVVVGQSYEPGCCGYNHTRYDVWDPQRGNFVPQWTSNLFPVYGPVPDGQAPFAMASQDSRTSAGCLAQVDGVAGMAVTAQACVPGLIYGSLMGLLAPDGRHVAELNGPADTLVVMDLTSVLAAPVGHGQCLAQEALAWEDNDTYLALASSNPRQQVVRCRVGSDQTEPVPDLPADARVVSRFGV